MNEQLIALSHDNLVQLCLLRREDVRAAMKEATKIFYKEDPEYKAKMAEYQRNWYLKNKSRHLENSKRWHERNKENLREYRKRYYERRKAAANHREETAAAAAFQPEEPERSTDEQKLAYWNAVLRELDEMFTAKEIDVETYINQSNIATSHALAAEIRIKSKKKN